MLSRKVAALALLFILLCCLAGPAGAQENGKPYKYAWKYATLAPNGIGWAIHIQNLLFPLIEERTHGEVKVKVYWGGVMGDDEDIISKMRIGQLNGAGLSGQGATIAIKELSVLELPFLFNGFDEVDYIREKMMPAFDKLAYGYGYFIIGLIDQDFDQIYSTKFDMTKVEDFRKSKFLTWFGPLEENLLQSLGAAPIPVNVPEIASTVRQGIADASIGPAIWMVGSQMHSIYKYVNPMKIRYSPALIIQNAEEFEQNEDTRGYKKMLLAERMSFTKEFVSRVRVDNEKCLSAMVQYGVKMSQMDEAGMEEFKNRTHPVWEEMAGKLYSQELLDEVLDNLADFRANK